MIVFIIGCYYGHKKWGEKFDEKLVLGILFLMCFAVDGFIIPFVELNWKVRFVYLIMLIFAIGLLSLAGIIAQHKWGRKTHSKGA